MCRVGAPNPTAQNPYRTIKGIANPVEVGAPLFARLGLIIITRVARIYGLNQMQRNCSREGF